MSRWIVTLLTAFTLVGAALATPVQADDRDRLHISRWGDRTGLSHILGGR